MTFLHALEKLRTALARVTSSGRFLPQIDGLRFVAIAAVIACHINDFHTAVLHIRPTAHWLTYVLSGGTFGVQLFFVISGFILALPFAEHVLLQRPAIPLKKYLLRRLTRLEPPYIINLLILFLLHVLLATSMRGMPTAADRFFGLLGPLAAHSSYLFNQIYYKSHITLSPVAWSLEIEVQFYLLAPLLACVFAIRPKLLRRTLMLAAIALFDGAACAGYTDGRWAVSIVGSMQWFLTGLLLADLYIVDWNEQPTCHFGWDAVSLIAWAVIILVPPEDKHHAFGLPIAVLLAYIAAFRGTVSSALFRQKWIATVGGMCYTLYLYHYIIISLLGRYLLPIPLPGSFAVAHILFSLLLSALILVICSGLFILFEKPFMYRDWPAKLADFLRNSDKKKPRPISPPA